ncbi:MAG: DUF5995 family protein [Prolixibacteraceae bacterium]|nr:DUF5995 family protein [Prolixibacteraceae bacterium]
MLPEQITTIDEVIAILGIIISESEKNNDTLGYFAALYQKVTIKVKEGIAAGSFEDGARMEQLDVVFAKRYIDAYFSFKKGEPITLSWQKAFNFSSHYQPIVLQHLLLGMNAHINLDLGIAATEISKGKNIADLENDFNRINEILSALVHDVEKNLSEVWPTLKLILKLAGKVDDFMIDFSMRLARNGAWKFANQLFSSPENQISSLIEVRDQKVTDKAHIVTNPGMVATIVLFIIRVMERGSVASKIRKLN